MCGRRRAYWVLLKVAALAARCREFHAARASAMFGLPAPAACYAHRERDGAHERDGMALAQRSGFSLRRFSAFVCGAYVVLSVAYGVTLLFGLAALPSADAPIADPHFTILELAILAIVPLLVAVFVVIHAQAPAGARHWSVMALAFATLLAGVTSIVHFSILTLARTEMFADPAIHAAVFGFAWPSVAYALDILAWDVFFPLAVIPAGFAIAPGRFAAPLRGLLRASGVLALLGLLGVALGDMQVRNVGILGYVGVFTVAVGVLGLHARAVWPRA